ncbi:MAG: winged helix-turn-helix transcriptional regulator [Verrucomicrobia bacterium]|nr:winged helix-turn-helix transcriptional regulator [Verrucomicrobiota bacterium]
MIEGLCGNKNVQKVLLFLFVNNKCYGTQLQRLLSAPLTPLQKAFARLEKGGIIHSYSEGKTKIFQFNPAYPLLDELRELLKKAYTLLPAEEKKKYCYVEEGDGSSGMTPEKRTKILLFFWERLQATHHLHFQARTSSKERGWDGKGLGEVAVTKENDNVLIFHEKGKWQNPEGREIDFTNAFRWTLDVLSGVISLEHLRHGHSRPVFLFHLAPASAHSLSSIDSHLCGGDIYFGQIFCDRHSLRLKWRVIGPKKNEEMDYFYR